MRHAIWIALLFAAHANAMFLRADFSSSSLNPNPEGWTFASPRPGLLTGSVLLDTSTANSSLQLFTDSNGVTCVNSVDSTMAGSLLNVSAEGTTIQATTNGVAAFGGDTASNCNPNEQFYFSTLSLQAGAVSLLLSLDSHHPVSFADVIGSSDPLATLLDGAFANGFLFFTNAQGQAQAFTGDFKIANVPEPGTKLLFFMGLLGIAVTRARVLRRGVR